MALIGGVSFLVAFAAVLSGLGEDSLFGFGFFPGVLALVIWSIATSVANYRAATDAAEAEFATDDPAQNRRERARIRPLPPGKSPGGGPAWRARWRAAPRSRMVERESMRFLNRVRKFDSCRGHPAFPLE